MEITLKDVPFAAEDSNIDSYRNTKTEEYDKFQPELGYGN